MTRATQHVVLCLVTLLLSSVITAALFAALNTDEPATIMLAPGVRVEYRRLMTMEYWWICSQWYHQIRIVVR